MSASSKEEITLYVFPLPEVVFFPTSSLPLNIFEPRYLQMVEDSERTKNQIAVAFTDPLDEFNLEDLNLVVGYGEPNVAVRREDGSRVILLQGRGKARLRRVLQKEPYLICLADVVEEVADVTPSNRFALNRYKGMVFKWLESNIQDEKQRSVIVGNLRSTQALLECFAMSLIRDADIRQTFLELNSSDERVLFLNGIY